MTLQNRMIQAKALIAKGVNATQDPRVKEYYELIAKAKAKAKPKPKVKKNGK